MFIGEEQRMPCFRLVNTPPNVEYAAPSWSWASVKYGARFLQQRIANGHDGVNNDNGPRALVAGVTSSSRDLFGATLGGYIDLACKNRAARLLEHHDEALEERQQLWDAWQGSKQQVEISCHLDDPTWNLVGSDLMMLYFGRFRAINSGTEYSCTDFFLDIALCIRAEHNDGDVHKYRRVGLAFFGGSGEQDDIDRFTLCEAFDGVSESQLTYV